MQLTAKASTPTKTLQKLHMSISKANFFNWFVLIYGFILEKGQIRNSFSKTGLFLPFLAQVFFF